MRQIINKISTSFNRFLTSLGMGMRLKLIIIFLLVKVVPLLILMLIAWRQINILGAQLRDIAVTDSSKALNDSAVEKIERMSTDTAARVAAFLYGRDDDILYLAKIEPTEENFRTFAESRRGRVAIPGEWKLADDGQSWVPLKECSNTRSGGISTNRENDDMDGFHYRNPDPFEYRYIPLYDEITYVGLDGSELVKVVTDSTKVNHPLDPRKRNVSDRSNTYIKAETYYGRLSELAPGEIYVSDVVGAYVGSNYIGMYVPGIVAEATGEWEDDIPYEPEAQAYAGMENPNGKRFEGIIRWAAPVTGADGAITGYVTLALNHDHIMAFVDHLTPQNKRYTEFPSAYEGNYASIWDYQCRNICHPRHHSIVGYDPETGEPQIPWLESSIYDRWQAGGAETWTDFAADIPTFEAQSRTKIPAPDLTKKGLLGLDGRYLNNAPQCTGGMDLTQEGGSGSFYILWSGLYKLNTVAAIPYYTGQYAPSKENGFSRRGFGFVAISAGLEDFTGPARETGEKLSETIEDNLALTFTQLLISTAIIVVFVVLIAILIASSLTGSITRLINGFSRFRAGERQFRFNAPVKDEFGILADSFDDMADNIVDCIKNPLILTDMDHTIIYMNDAGLDLCRKTLDQVVGFSYQESSIYPMGTRYCPITALEEGHEAEIYYLEKSGRYLRGAANYFLSKDGQRIGYQIESADVTEMVCEQLEIEEQRTLLDMIFSASPDLIWYQDIKRCYQAVNPRFAGIAGRSTEAFIGKTAQEILPEQIAEVFIKNDAKAFRQLTPLYSEEQIRFSDSHEETLESVRTPILDAGKKLVGVLGFARNVSSRVIIENQLRSIKLELEDAVNSANSANEHKGEFLARMSHEIRTPMNAIIGITTIVLKKLDEMPDASAAVCDINGHMHQIEASSQHLLGLLNDILDISKIEAGKIELIDEVVGLPKLVGTVAGIIKPRCDEKNILFLTKFETFEPSSVISDSLRLRQVLINLLGNAVKFTPECGVVEFSMARMERCGGRVLVEFAVSDTGIGIAADALESIFQPFEQGHRTISKRYGGTGLGLAISQKIVQMFGGDIKIKSTIGGGSEFSFRIWMEETDCDPNEESMAADIEGKFAGRRILLVDDVEVNRMIVSSMLENSGIEIDEADDGLTALKRFEESPEGAYSMILMDVQMPNMDGYEASMAIRKLDREDAKKVPIVTLTANAFKEDIDKALRHGMNAHISKPVEMDKLADILLKYLTPKI